MDKFVATHLTVDDAVHGPATMGYYARADLPFYHALADAFTVCDGYFSSVIGPTDSNRLMAMAASIDPDGVAGGPVVETFDTRVGEYGKLTFPTMPERLQAAGVSWKVYNDRLGELALSPLPYFKAFTDPFSVTGVELVGRGLTPHFPDDFAQDVRWNKLPAVSWIVPPLAQCEHPAAPPAYGEYLVHSVLSTLVSNPAVWAQTVLFVVHDENGGFFDHVPPPTAPAGDTGGNHSREPASRRGRDRRPRRPRLPRSGVPGHLAVQPRRLRVLAPVRPHLAAPFHRDQVRRRGAQPVFLAARRHRRPDSGARAGEAAEHRRARPCPRPRSARPASPSRQSSTRWPAPSTWASPTRRPRLNAMPVQETAPARPPVP